MLQKENDSKLCQKEKVKDDSLKGRSMSGLEGIIWKTVWTMLWCGRLVCVGGESRDMINLMSV